ncbi:MAG: PPC domain-containing protein [Verrucomicrobiales bacterium]|nr:PPC domain-containing protein [Verrucomicrobiales bacterium]
MKRVLMTRSAASAVFLKRVLSAILLSALLLPGADALAASPDLQNTIPRGGQRGSEVKVTLMGNRLDDAEELLFHSPGISVKDLKVIDTRKVEATFVIAPDCRLGEHHVRVRCRSGISYARNFWISQFPNVAEVEPNDDFEAPQAIDLNVTIEAEAKPEETDYYKVTAKKGQRLSVEIEGLRINNVRNNIAIDPFVAILDKDRFELASADGSALLKQESIVSVIIPEDGEYTIEVRDSAYQGRGRYRAHIGTFPRPTAIFPAGGKAGTEVEFSMLGDVKGTFKTKATLPQSTPEGTFGVLAGHEGQFPPSPNRVRISDFDNVLEQEPNNSSTQMKEVAAPALPLAFNGILESEGDIDYFRFSAKKGQRFRMRVYANTIGSPVDPVLNLYDSTMKSLGGSDDADGSKDSRVDFNVPADGEYLVRVKDMLNRGGPDFVYRIESEVRKPVLDVTMPEMLRRDLQYRKQFNVPRGGYYAMTVNTTRRDFSGDLVFEMPKLPAGVTWESATIPKSVSQFPILLKAAPDAPLGGGLYSLHVKNTDAEKPLSGTFKQPLDLVRGPQNGVEYYTRYNEDLPVAVVEELPFSITVDQPKVPIVRNGMMKLKVRAHRKEGYDKRIIVRMLWKPPGITTPASMTFGEKDTELEYELNANSSAEVNTWNIGVLAESDGGKGLMKTASPFVKLSVEEPFVNMKLSMATTKQGLPTEMVAEVENLREFGGKADVQLFGLPAHATTPVVKIDQSSEGFSFPIETSEKTPVGQHKNLFCTVTVLKEGQPIVHRVGMGGVIRVDPKPKEPVAAPAKPAETKVVAKTAPKEKPLSRLEQLRLEAKKEAAAQ